MDELDFSNNHIIKFLIEKRFRLARHLVFLVAFLCLLGIGDFYRKFPPSIAIWVVVVIYFIFIIMFYLNMYVLVPHLLFKNKYMIYSISLIVLVLLGLNALGFFFDHYFNPYRLIPNDVMEGDKYYTNLLLCVSFISLSTTIKLLQNWMKDKERIVELKSLTYAMELNELKNQVSPHFLFNMLNNVKALIRKEPEMATTVIMKLSEFLRYQLYESNQGRVLLTSEVDFILNFLNLEKIRRDNLMIHFDCQLEKNGTTPLFIPSGLFTVFVENAIKYSVDINEGESYVKVDIKVEDKTLYFTCINSKSVDFLILKNKNGGLGLTNIKRRLELIYVGKHKLTITPEEHLFTVNLIIPL